MDSENWQNQSYCWLSSARYPKPLDATTSKKWRLLHEGLGVDMRVIGFSQTLRPHRFHQAAHFYLLPKPSLSLLRYIIMFFIMPFIALWIIFRHNTKVLIAQSPYEGAIGAGIKFFCRILRKKVFLVVESHNDFEEVLFLQRNIPFQGLYNHLMKTATNIAFKHADALRCISDATHNQVRRYNQSAPIEQFITWTDLDVFIATPRKVPVHETHDLVYAGVLVPGKGVHHLLRAFAKSRHPDANLYLIGEAQNADYEQELRNIVQETDIQDVTHFLGKVSQQQLADYFSSVRVMVLPSLSEGLGRVIIEAMICGTPVVASEIGGIPELVDDGVTGYLVPPDDMETLADSLTKINDNADIAKMGAVAKQRTLARFSTDAYVQGYGNLFQKVMRLHE